MKKTIRGKGTNNFLNCQKKDAPSSRTWRESPFMLKPNLKESIH